MKTKKKKRNRRSSSSPTDANHQKNDHLSSKLTESNKERKKRKIQPRKAENLPSPSLSSKKSSNNNNNAEEEYPLPFPKSSNNKQRPKNRFLRCVNPYQESFQAALETSYLGFEIDSLVVNDDDDDDLKKNSIFYHSKSSRNNNEQTKNTSYFHHDGIEEALLTMDRYGLFRTDVTQPFGLGTKCAKTYVTRCLLGEEGTTYKYLGLRMFAHPWNVVAHDKKQLDKKKSTESSSMSLEDALNQISDLNDSLTARTAYHLKQLDVKRKALKKNAKANNNNDKKTTIKGRAKFDVALINRMIDMKELKKEPTMGDGRCSVSWHADSSLEHYSSIAVYHTIMDESYVNKRISDDDQGNHKDNKESNQSMKQNTSNSDRWSIALRVGTYVQLVY